MRTHGDLINKNYQYEDDAGEVDYFQRYYWFFSVNSIDWSCPYSVPELNEY